VILWEKSKTMRYLVCGLGKSGTSVLYHSILKACRSKYPDLVFGASFEDTSESSVALMESASPFVQKLLLNDQSHVDLIERYKTRFDKILLIVRDPRDRFVSEFFYSFFHRPYLACNDDIFRVFFDGVYKQAQNPGYISMRNLSISIQIANKILNTSIDIFANQNNQKQWRIQDQENYAMELSGGENVHTIRYENFIANQTEILDVTGLSVSSDMEIPEKRVARNGAPGDWKNWFTQLDLDHIQDESRLFMEYFSYSFAERAASEFPPFETRKYVLDYIVSLVNSSRLSNKKPALTLDDLISAGKA